jgi:1-acyl-sn-glycerol-3-phosphate acyltransferase
MPSAVKPEISPAVLRWFGRYTRLYLRRHLHALRVVRGSAPRALEGWPVIVCLNHPSWWDPLVALTLAQQTFDKRTHYAPIDAVALAKYPIFKRIGMFGVDASTKGARAFLQTGQAILNDLDSTLWITAQGAFTDVRVRPVHLRGGIGHLIHSLPRVAVVPLALEYVYWEERAPEVLACWGDPMLVSGSDCVAREWITSVAAALEETQDRLAVLAQRREKQAFEVLLCGSSGIGGVYDLWRSLRARLNGRSFAPQHGSEEF